MMKKFTTFTLAIVFTLTFATVIFADQAAYITEEQAKEAVKLLQEKKEIKHFCQPCGDKTARFEKIETIEAAPTGFKNFWEVKVNGKGIDLAYVYYEKKEGKWKNTAQRLDLEVSDVPRFLPEGD